MVNSTYKIYAKILNQKLRAITDALLRKEQLDFRKGRSTMHALFVFQQIIENGQKYNEEMHIAFVCYGKSS